MFQTNQVYTDRAAKLPVLLVFDVNETLSNMAPLSARFEEVGASGQLAGIWFAGLLRDGFALAVGRARLGTDTNQDQSQGSRQIYANAGRTIAVSTQRRTNAGQECRCCGDPPLIELHQSAVIYTNGTQTVFA
jgi:hypothetical protein